VKTKLDFQTAIAAEISKYPTAYQLYQAQDPILLAQLDAMAAMLGMVSAEMDVAANEPWTKARDVTVLADAALKGVLPFGRPMKVKLSVANTGSTPVTIATGRKLLDTQGRNYIVTLGADVAAGGTAFIEAMQQSERSITHVVALSQPFYGIPIDAPEGNKVIAEIRVTDMQANAFEYVSGYINIEDGQKVFHIESDETKAVFIKFGASGIAGYQPQTNEQFSVTVIETEADIEVSAGSQFAFEYSYSLYENGVTMTLSEVLSKGQNPMDIATMREVTSYPSVYDNSAAFLGNFDFLIRRNLSPFKFLSVWNEQREEEARGADVANINCLFVSAEKEGMTTAALQNEITRIITNADNSYRVKFVAIAHQEIPVSITAYVQAIYDFEQVKEQIRQLVIAEYGQDSMFAKRGSNRIRYKRLYDMLENNVQALQGVNSDFTLTINDTATILPESFRYVSNTSLTITILQG
jgi:hypothetical protein